MISSQGTKHFRWPSHLIFYVYKAYCNPDKMCGIKEIWTLKKKPQTRVSLVYVFQVDLSQWGKYSKITNDYVWTLVVCTLPLKLVSFYSPLTHL